jgi:hypothetical protein
VRRIEGLREDPLVEFEPAQFAIDVERGILQVLRIDGARLRRERSQLRFCRCGPAPPAVGSLTAFDRATLPNLES